MLILALRDRIEHDYCPQGGVSGGSSWPGLSFINATLFYTISLLIHVNGGPMLMMTYAVLMTFTVIVAFAMAGSASLGFWLECLKLLDRERAKPGRLL